MNYKFFVPSVVLLALLASCSSKEVLPNPETISVSAITVNPTSITITEGESSTITATISPSNANNKKVIWSSSDASVVTVNDGKVSGVTKGTATITATAEDNGKTAQCSVTVNAKSGGDNGGGSGSNNNVITGDYSYLGYGYVNVYGTCNVQELAGASVTYGIMYSDTDLTTDGVTAKAYELDGNNRFCCKIPVQPGGITYYYRAVAARSGESFFGEIKSFKTRELIPEQDSMVDMGVSVKWASCNLGAQKPEENGHFYAWGETVPKTTGGVSTYKYYSDGKYTKYTGNNGDGKTVLENEDDAAHVNLGGNWRMPTKSEFQELIDNCTLFNDIAYNGTNGMALVSDITEKVLFFPKSDDYQHSFYYWSSSLYSQVNNAYCFRTDFNGAGTIGYHDRSSIQPIRPVYASSSIPSASLSISVSDITASDCKVSISTDSQNTYFWYIVKKEVWDEYGSEYVCDYYISATDNLSEYLDKGNVSYGWDGLSSKTEYIVFATFCNSNGVRSGEIYSITFTTK